MLLNDASILFQHLVYTITINLIVNEDASFEMNKNNPHHFFIIYIQLKKNNVEIKNNLCVYIPEMCFDIFTWLPNVYLYKIEITLITTLY